MDVESRVVILREVQPDVEELRRNLAKCLERERGG